MTINRRANIILSILTIILVLFTNIEASILSGEKRNRENYDEEPATKRRRLNEENTSNKSEEIGFSDKKFWDIFYKNAIDYKSTKNRDIYLFIGDTGSGKSTTINYILGHELIKTTKDDINKGKVEVHNIAKSIKVKDTLDDIVVPKKIKKNTPWAKIDGGISCTSTPECYKHPEENVLLIDCPGFKDTKGVEQRIFNALTTRSIIENSKSVKGIFLVIEFPALKASRGILLSEVIERLSKMIILDNKSTKLIHILITKTEPRRIESVKQHLESVKKDETQTTLKWLKNKMKSLTHRKNNDNQKINNKDSYLKEFVGDILKENRYHIINPIDKGESWRKIEESMDKNLGISKEEFKKYFFIRVAGIDAVGILSGAFNRAAEPLIIIINNWINNPIRIEMRRKNIEKLNQLKKTSQSNLRKESKQLINVEIKRLEREEELLHEKQKSLSFGDLIPFRKDRISFSNRVLEETKSLSYDDLPYVRYDKNDIVYGWREKVILKGPNQGVYKGEFTAEPSYIFGRFSLLEVIFYVKKETINEAEINQIKDKKKEIQKEIDKLVKKISAYEETKNVLKEITEQIQEEKNDIENTEKKLIVVKNSLQEPENKNRLKFFQENKKMLSTFFNQKETKLVLKLIKRWEGDMQENNNNKIEKENEHKEDE